jgi:fructose-bisphosphate aldolase class I
MGFCRVNTDALIATSHAMLRDGRGLLAMDESTGTCDKRLLAAGIPATAEYRRAWRELLVTAPGLGESIGGAILYDETIRQSTTAGVRFADVLSQAGIIVGIKVDTGAKPLALRDRETVTEGLDGLRDRLADYASLGARFAKWRGVMSIGGQRPSAGCIRANAEALARYAALCQEAAIVPVIEPEVLMEGAHGLRDCAEATEIVLHGVFAALRRQGVCLEGMILKPNMVLAGSGCADQPTDAEVAEATLRCLRRAVPACVPGIAFLSGGQSGELATRRLAAMNAASGGSGRTPPWALSFSFARAIQHPALEVWHGQAANVAAAQRALLHRAAANRAARLGRGPLAAAA